MLLLSLVVFSFLPALLVMSYIIFTLVKWKHKINFQLPSGNYSEPVSIVIAAYNEEEYIFDKLDFLLSEEEWIPGSEVIVVSAGSTDKTNSILEEFALDERVTLVIIKEHLTKPLALNRGVAISKNELIVFSDCRQTLSKGAVKVIVSFFVQPDIGAVNATLSDTKYGGKTSLLRKISNIICLSESCKGSSLNLHGAFYAQRKELFKPFPTHLIHDDLFSLVNTVAQKKRLIQTDKVLVFDVPLSSYYERTRIERLVKGLLSFATQHWNLIRQLSLPYKIRFLFYKYLKLFFPMFVLLGSVPLIYLVSAWIGWKMCLSLILLPFILLGIHAKGRKFIALLFRIQLYFLVSLFCFVVLKKREGYYQKLNVKPA